MTDDRIRSAPSIPHDHELCDGCVESVEYEAALRAALAAAEGSRDEWERLHARISELSKRDLTLAAERVAAAEEAWREAEVDATRHADARLRAEERAEQAERERDADRERWELTQKSELTNAEAQVRTLREALELVDADLACVVAKTHGFPHIATHAQRGRERIGAALGEKNDGT